MTSFVFKGELIDMAVNPTANRRKPRVVYSKQRQTGVRISLGADRKRGALPPGKRISKNGKPYYEYRKNRTDKTGLKT